MSIGRSTPQAATMFRLGWRGDATHFERRIASAMIALATAAMVLSTGFLGIICATFQERLETDHSRIADGWFSGEDATADGARWRIVADAVEDRWVDVIIVVPEESTPLPPGLEAWPEPGTVVLSPALAAHPDGAIIAERYGVLSQQQVQGDGLVSPQERIAYVRPSAATEQQTFGYSVSSFGMPSPVELTSEGLTGGPARQRGIWNITIGFTLGVIAPALLFMAIASRTASARRDQRRQMLHILGAGRREDLAFLLGVFAVPFTVGITSAGAVITALMVFDLYIPIGRYTIQSADLRAHLLWVIGAVLLGASIAAAMLLGLNQLRRHRGTRPRSSQRPDKLRQMLPLPLAAVAMIIAWLNTGRWELSALRLFVTYGGIAAVAICLPGFIGIITSLAARALAAWGQRYGSVSALVAGRLMMADPGAVRRLSAGMALVIILVAHLMTLGTMTTSAFREAAALRDRFGDSLLVLDTSRSGDEAPQLVDDALSGNGDVIAVMTQYGNSPSDPVRATVTGSCDALRALGLPCTDGPLETSDRVDDDRGRWMLGGIDEVQIAVGSAWDISPDEEAPAIYAVSLDGEDLPREEIAIELSQQVLPRPELSNIGEEWLLGYWTGYDSFYRWHPLIAVVATVLLALAISGVVLGDSDGASDRLGVLSMWAPGPGLSLGVAVGRVLIPLLAAIVTGGVTAFATTFPYTLPPFNGFLPPGYFLATSVLPVLAALVMAAIAALAQHRALRRWRPGASSA